MAITVINSQNMVLWTNTTIPADMSTADYEDVITGGEAVGCPQSLGALEQTRAVTEYKCMSSNETAKALGGIERGNIEVGLLFDPADTAGQDALRTAFADNSQILIGIELSDGTWPRGTGANGTTFAFIGAISGVSLGIVQDEAVTYTVTVEVASEIIEIAADTAV